MRLSTEKAIEFVENLEKYHPIQKYWDESNERHRQEKNTENYPYSYFRGVLIRKIAEIIEALQQENNGWRERYDELDAGHSRLFKDFCKLQAENEQLQAQVARMRDALVIANNYMPDIGQFCACGKCKTCGADINYAGYEHCVKCARGIIDAALSDAPADYHNPADVEALIMAREAIKAAWSDGSANAAMDKASEALAAIDKAIGG